MLFNNGELVIHLTDVNYRATDSIKIMGVHFNTFYGGSDSTWYPDEMNSIDFRVSHFYFLKTLLQNFALDEYTDSLLPSCTDCTPQPSGPAVPVGSPGCTAGDISLQCTPRKSKILSKFVKNLFYSKIVTYHFLFRVASTLTETLIRQILTLEVVLIQPVPGKY